MTEFKWRNVNVFCDGKLIETTGFTYKPRGTLHSQYRIIGLRQFFTKNKKSKKSKR